MRIGLHTSIAGSLEGSALEAARLGANTFQIFSSSPRQWKASKPSQPAIQLLNRARERHDLHPLAIHDNYLINLASVHEDLRAKSIEACREELERAIAIQLACHPRIPLRTLDALHVATCDLHRCGALSTTDGRMRAACEQLAITLLPARPEDVSVRLHS